MKHVFPLFLLLVVSCTDITELPKSLPDTTEYVTIFASVDGGNGRISPSGEVSIAKDKSKEFIFLPDSGYEIKSVKVDGYSVAITSSYVFTNVYSDRSIRVQFQKIY